MRKPAFCICENKDADQLRGNREADQRPCFRYIDSTSQVRNFKPLATFCGCTAWFVWDLVGNPEDQFSHNEAHLIFIGEKISFNYTPRKLCLWEGILFSRCPSEQTNERTKVCP